MHQSPTLRSPKKYGTCGQPSQIPTGDRRASCVALRYPSRWMEEFARDMERSLPEHPVSELHTNPMAMLTGYMQEIHKGSVPMGPVPQRNSYCSEKFAGKNRACEDNSWKAEEN